MALERSHGKARPTLPRSSDLAVPRTEREPDRSRDARGRALPGNDLAKGRGWKRAIGKMLGRDVGQGVSAVVAEEAWKVLCGLLRELPHRGPTVRQLATLQARHVALAAYFGARAVELGLDSPAGEAADERATKHGQRAERLAVTALDVATRMAAADRAKPLDADAWAAMVAEGSKPRAREGTE